MYTRYLITEHMDFEKQKALVRELKKADIDAEYGLTERGHGVAISPMNKSEVTRMTVICKKYGVTPVCREVK